MTTKSDVSTLVNGRVANQATYRATRIEGWIDGNGHRQKQDRRTQTNTKGRQK